MLQRSLTLLVWLLVAASALAWAKRFGPVAVALPGPPAAGTDWGATAPAGSAQALARLLGADRAEGAPDPMGQPEPGGGDLARLTLQGVIGYGGGTAGVALIAIDGKPARAWPVGASLEPGLTLQALGLRSATLQGARGLFTLQMAGPATAMAAPPSAPAVPRAVPAAAPPQGSVRLAAPGEMLSPGRRLRLRAPGTGGAAAGP